MEGSCGVCVGALQKHMSMYTARSNWKHPPLALVVSPFSKDDDHLTGS